MHYLSLSALGSLAESRVPNCKKMAGQSVYNFLCYTTCSNQQLLRIFWQLRKTRPFPKKWLLTILQSNRKRIKIVWLYIETRHIQYRHQNNYGAKFVRDNYCKFLGDGAWPLQFVAPWVTWSSCNIISIGYMVNYNFDNLDSAFRTVIFENVSLI